MTPHPSPLFIQSLDKALLVLQAFGEDERFLSEADIARLAGIHRSSAQRIVHTLEQLGYLHRDPGTGRYGLTQKILALSHGYLRHNVILNYAWPHLIELNQRLKETVNLLVLDGRDIVYIARLRRRVMDHEDQVIGSRFPAYCAASGLAMLSRLKPEDSTHIIQTSAFEKITPFTDIDPDSIQARLVQARKQGFAITENQTVLGDISIGAPIMGQSQSVAAGISLSVSNRHWSVDQVVRKLSPLLIATASSISTVLSSVIDHDE